LQSRRAGTAHYTHKSLLSHNLRTIPLQIGFVWRDRCLFVVLPLGRRKILRLYGLPNWLCSAQTSMVMAVGVRSSIRNPKSAFRNPSIGFVSHNGLSPQRHRGHAERLRVLFFVRRLRGLLGAAMVNSSSRRSASHSFLFSWIAIIHARRFGVKKNPDCVRCATGIELRAGPVAAGDLRFGSPDDAGPDPHVRAEQLRSSTWPPITRAARTSHSPGNRWPPPFHSRRPSRHGRQVSGRSRRHGTRIPSRRPCGCASCRIPGR
jgi:hypothetical protein